MSRFFYCYYSYSKALATAVPPNANLMHMFQKKAELHCCDLWVWMWAIKHVNWHKTICVCVRRKFRIKRIKKRNREKKSAEIDKCLFSTDLLNHHFYLLNLHTVCFWLDTHTHLHLSIHFLVMNYFALITLTRSVCCSLARILLL